MRGLAGNVWHGRFLEQSADELQKLNNSISYDIRLFSQDIEGSRAHAKMLQRIDIFKQVLRLFVGLRPAPGFVFSGFVFLLKYVFIKFAGFKVVCSLATLL